MSSAESFSKLGHIWGCNCMHLLELELDVIAPCLASAVFRMKQSTWPNERSDSKHPKMAKLVQPFPANPIAKPQIWGTHACM